MIYILPAATTGWLVITCIFFAKIGYRSNRTFLAAAATTGYASFSIDNFGSYGMSLIFCKHPVFTHFTACHAAIAFYIVDHWIPYVAHCCVHSVLLYFLLLGISLSLHLKVPLCSVKKSRSPSGAVENLPRQPSCRRQVIPGCIFPLMSVTERFMYLSASSSGTPIRPTGPLKALHQPTTFTEILIKKVPPRSCTRFNQ